MNSRALTSNSYTDAPVISGKLPQRILSAVCGILVIFSGVQMPAKSVEVNSRENSVQNLYRPVADWSGRLILPDVSERKSDGGVYLEVENAPAAYAHLIGQKVWVKWDANSIHQPWLQRAVTDIEFDEITRASMANDNIHPTRLNGWKNVSPLESLAGARAKDDVQVELDIRTLNQVDNEWVLSIGDEPFQIEGVEKTFVRFIAPDGEKRYRIQHYNPNSQSFDGPEEIAVFPTVGTVPQGATVEQSSIENIEKSPLNDSGWYLYGDRDPAGRFVVEAIEPAEAFLLEPTQIREGRYATLEHILRSKWQQMPLHRIQRTLLDNNGNAIAKTNPTPSAIAQRTRQLWYPGDIALVVHTFGWRGGERGDKATFGLVPGHFSFGFAKVVRDEFTGKTRFEVVYRQVYGHNREGIIAGAMRSPAYLGSLERGWMYTLPISDVMVRIPELTVPYQLSDRTFDPLTTIEQELALMTARYRTGPGNGASSITPTTSCVQDSNQALFAAVRRLKNEVLADKTVEQWMTNNANQYDVRRFHRLESLLSDVESQVLIPLGIVPIGWQGDNEYVAAHRKGAGGFIEALKTWKTIVPRSAEMELLRIFSRHGATMVDFQSAMTGGEIAGIYPQAPTVIFHHDSPEMLGHSR